MAPESGYPRRVSMAYILGFSNKPFKTVKPHPLLQPGAMIEYVASDGRKGALTNKNKARLTAANLSKVPEGKTEAQKASAEPKSASKKDSKKESKKPQSKNALSEVGDIFGGLLGGDGENKDEEEKNASGWTAEQDKQLLDWKADNISAPWTNFATTIDKSADECKERFKEIRPKDWKPNNAKGAKKGKGNAGGDGGGKKGKGAQKNQKKKDETSADNAWGFDNQNNDFSNGFGDNNNGWDQANDNNWNQDGADGFAAANSDPWNQNGADGFEATGADNTAGWDANAAGNSWDNSGNTGDNDWNAANNSGGDGFGGFDTNNNDNKWDSFSNANKTNKSSKSKSSNKNGDAGWDNAWTAPAKSASKADSNKDSKAGSKKSSATVKHTREVHPDDTFTDDELRIVARILKQDAAMVWSRVSWRFKDKTGRMVQPGVFEKKMMEAMKRAE